MAKCEVCGKYAEVHHIINRCQGGLEFELNYKYLCSEHHRGEQGPHRNWALDIKYKLEMQGKLSILLCKEYYTIEELSKILNINKSKVKKTTKNIKRYKEGYKKQDILLKLMGNKIYSEYMLECYYDFVPLIVG
ncbi:HNH endonuclease signature motif containing protein [Clostridium rectalis]|uniref:HNH endonuclease signature motif containing protein n=1 Tax=Clostridium rectalis TaxID=2040295 RepID=UPI000F641FB3|nr:HNH endonuclease signature motif containing protein [Clostridium rectalis]